MQTVTSADGTSIAYERLGDGEPLIVVGGATCDRERMRPLSERFASECAAILYDRRGRGDSADTLPFAVERELEDIAALIDAQGAAAAVYGHSSGAALALEATAAGLPITALVVHEAPYGSGDPDEAAAARDYGKRIRALIAADRFGDAIELFMSTTGMAAEMIAAMRAAPGWGSIEALAPTLVYDSAVMGDLERGGTAPWDRVESVRVPVLAIAGGASPDWMIGVAERIAATVADGRFLVLEGEGHVVDPDVLVPPIAGFLRDVVDVPTS